MVNNTTLATGYGAYTLIHINLPIRYIGPFKELMLSTNLVWQR